jgi:CheY-like chemotaxis protein
MKRILLIEDDEDFRGVLRTALELRGFEVAQAADGDEGIRSFCQQEPDLVLCDLFMPQKEGLETIRELRRNFPEVKIIAMSGGAFGGRMDLLSVARLMGANGLLQKPFDQPTLLATIEKVLGNSTA